MIFQAILNTLYQVISFIAYPLKQLPDVSLGTGFTDAINTANGYLSALNDIIPIDTILTLLGVYVAIETAYFTYKFIMWVIKRFPTQS